MNEAELEQALKDKGLNAPRVAPDAVERAIVGEQYHVFPGTTTTICCLRMDNGFTVIGESACVVPANFDADIGRKLARDDARRKAWSYMGFRLAETLAAKAAP